MINWKRYNDATKDGRFNTDLLFLGTKTGSYSLKSGESLDDSSMPFSVEVVSMNAGQIVFDINFR